ncbi:hypothetical protein AVEN_265365-1 [Araneus ventricosus]|uniref:Uncharacterized protein n=1 Tax=Araneus ventricosus TaxID=182803 RepID=A0A4Y2MAA7_ARAVE|nr:hypothetical protein AVEN_265365-1 [Araneus ventricosus]
MATCQMLLQQSEEMKITWCENRSRNKCAELSNTSTTETLDHPFYSRDLAPSDFHLYTGIIKIRTQVSDSLNDDFLDFFIGSEMATCQVLLQQSEEMKITWCENRSRNRCAEL